jgi:hypothetical protein
MCRNRQTQKNYEGTSNATKVRRKVSATQRPIELRDRSRAPATGEQRMATARIPNDITNTDTTKI